MKLFFVDDGSTDNSREILKNYNLSKYSKFKTYLIILIKEKAFTVIKGIKNAKGEYVLFSDIDLATPLEEADKLISQTKKGYEIIIGSRSTQRKGAPFLRKAMALGFIPTSTNAPGSSTPGSSTFTSGGVSTTHFS